MANLPFATRILRRGAFSGKYATMDRLELVKIIDGRLAELNLSAAEASRRAVSNQYLVRNIKERGSVPTVEAATKLLSVLGMDLIAVPRGQDMSPSLLAEPINVQFQDPLIPHRGLASCGVSGWGRPEAMDPLPQPSNLKDATAFYVEAVGRSMVPEGINAGDMILVSPATSPLPGDRVYVEDREGRGAVKRLTNISDDKLFLRGWIEQDDQLQQFNETRFRDYVTTLGTVIAVFDRKPEHGQRIAQRIDPVPRSDREISVPVLGYAAAGNDIVFDADNAPVEGVAAPPINASALGALLIRGNSGAPLVRDGGTIYIDLSRPFMPTDCIGSLVIACEKDGGNYLKTLRRGDDGKLWNLESVDHRFETMTNVDLEQVFPVRWIAL